jgi:hypothetical protein
MRHLADQFPCGLAGQARVRIKRNHIADIGRNGRRVNAEHDKGGIRCAAQQPVQLVQLAAFALPANPPAFAFVP